MKRIPARPDMGHLKKQAKQLLAAYRAGVSSINFARVCVIASACVCVCVCFSLTFSGYFHVFVRLWLLFFAPA